MSKNQKGPAGAEAGHEPFVCLLGGDGRKDSSRGAAQQGRDRRLALHTVFNDDGHHQGWEVRHA